MPVSHQRFMSANTLVLAALLPVAWTLLASSAADAAAARPKPAPAPKADPAAQARQQRTEAEAAKVAERVFSHAIVIDTHADTPQMMLDDGYDLADPNSPYMISIPKMRTGHLGAEFMSIWVDVDWPRDDLIHRALDLIDVVDEQVASHSSDLEAARTADDVVRIHRQGKLAILMGLEGGHIIEDDPRALDIF